MSNLEQKVMANVAMIYTARKLVGRTAFECYALVLSVLGVAFFVSIPNVAHNLSLVAQGGAGSVMIFILTAVVSTTLVVQLALLFGTVALASLVANFLKSSRPVFA